MIEIKHRLTGAVIYQSEKATPREAVIEAGKARAYLAGAYLAGADLAGANLAGANLAGADLAGAYLADAYLTDAYLAGADLAGAYLAGAYLADADLAGANLTDANLTDAYLTDAYLTDADLAGAYLAGAYLAGAKNLPAASQTSAPREPYNRSKSAGERAARFREHHPEVPTVEALDQKILDAITTGGGALDMGAWHTCETTHCRAGWAIALAGEAGKKLETEHGPYHAGVMIYLASTGRTPHFFASNKAAFEDIKRCAEMEAQGGNRREE